MSDEEPQETEALKSWKRRALEAEDQCASVLRQTQAAVGVEPGAAVRALVEDRDALATERDEAEAERDRLLRKLGEVRTLAMRWAGLAKSLDNPRVMESFAFQLLDILGPDAITEALQRIADVSKTLAASHGTGHRRHWKELDDAVRALSVARPKS